jgi:hypothetical protein
MCRVLITITAAASLLVGAAVAFQAKATIGAGLSGSVGYPVRCCKTQVVMVSQ